MKSPKVTSSSTTTTKHSTAQASGATAASDAVAMLKQDHRNVEALFREFKSASQGEKEQLVQRICNELIVHAMLEEEVFYKECRDRGVESVVLDEAQIEHDTAKVLIQDLLSGEPGSEFYDAKVTVLSEYIKHHVGEEEKPSEGIFAKAKKQGLDMSALGQRLQARKQQLMQKAEANELSPPSPRALKLKSSQEDQEYRNMPRYSNDRDRDERGRFMSDDDDDRRYSRSRSSSRDEGDADRGGRGRSRDDDDVDRGGRGRGGWFGDSEGHSEAAHSRRGSSRYDDDDNDRGRGGGRDRGRGGWFGDPEGHAEAARQRWEDDDRGSRSSPSRSSSRYENDEDRGSRSSSSRSSSRYESDDDRSGGRGRGRGGWFGDSEGHGEAARQRWEDDDDRGGRRNAGSRTSSRSEDDDDGRGRGRGGWFGDSEGHSRASRRGWRDRD
jgi:hypothetical protein